MNTDDKLDAIAKHIRHAQELLAELPARMRREADALILAEYLDRAQERIQEWSPKGVVRRLST